MLFTDSFTLPGHDTIRIVFEPTLAAGRARLWLPADLEVFAEDGGPILQIGRPETIEELEAAVVRAEGAWGKHKAVWFAQEDPR